MTQQKDAFTDLASALQNNNNNGGNSGNNQSNSSKPSQTVTDNSGQAVTLGINGNVKQK